LADLSRASSTAKRIAASPDGLPSQATTTASRTNVACGSWPSRMRGPPRRRRPPITVAAH